ncbi:IMPACT family protein [Parapusillimonas sp. JC17]|uniref:IMPACT family protein n=1 Tax=Parapusillimonas sp. JC17 TaxID=3445768 RepID=UPI003FA02908
MAYTLAGQATYQEDIKKSRFLVFASPVRTPDEAMAFFAAHAVGEATHNCWAYRIGNEYRFNDDGEPGGTAGRPILQAIEGQDCDRVAVLVVRWFGGIKLGPGGLIRAYGGAAAQCLRLAEKIEIVDEVELDCSCAFSDMALVQSRFASVEIRVLHEAFDAEGVQWRLALPRGRADEFLRLFTDLTRGQGRLTGSDPEWGLTP